MKIVTIGIAGGTGSGKTTLARNIVSHFGEQITLICHDDYYKANDELYYAEREKLNYDHPDAFDTPLLVSHLRALRRGETIEAPYTTTPRTTAARQRAPSSQRESFF